MRTLILLLCLCGVASADYREPESWYVKALARNLKERGYTNVKINPVVRDNKRRVTYADLSWTDNQGLEWIAEVDFAEKWAEGVGQVLYYSYETQKNGALFLIGTKNSKLNQAYHHRAFIALAPLRGKLKGNSQLPVYFHGWEKTKDVYRASR